MKKDENLDSEIMQKLIKKYEEQNKALEKLLKKLEQKEEIISKENSKN